jgi:hypothetical protein
MRFLRSLAVVAAAALLWLGGDAGFPGVAKVDAAATFVLQYDATVPLAARPAIQAAADTWSSILVSPIPINIAVSFFAYNIPPAGIPPRLTLGGPAGAVTKSNLFGLPLPNTEYPEALVKALTGHEFHPTVPELFISINSSIDWYLGTDGNTGGKYDLRTAVTRELARGLALDTTFTPFAQPSYPAGGWGWPPSPYPWVMDRFVVNGAGQVLVDAFPNHSTALRDQINGNDLFFNGPFARAANGGLRPKLFARHYLEWYYVDDNDYLDETAFAPGTPNALLTVRLNPGEVIHRPGPVILAMMRDVGWTVGARVRAAADFDGDRKSDLSIFRPSTGAWHNRFSSTGSHVQATWGGAGDVPLDGDFNGDGANDIAVFRPSTGEWWIQGLSPVIYGGNGDVPVAQDFTGDRTTDIGVFRPSTGQWFIRGLSAVTFGGAGDVPVPQDYTGDGLADIAIFRPSTGTWYVRGGFSLAWGGPGDVPVPADYNGDGVAEVAIFRPSTGAWYIPGQSAIIWGGPGDVPVVGDYDGNGVADIGVFRPSNGTWYVRGIATMVWGGTGDLPIERRP